MFDLFAGQDNCRHFGLESSPKKIQGMDLGSSFVFVVGFGEWVTHATKFAQFEIIGFLTKKCLGWGKVLKQWCGLTVDQIGCCVKSIGPICEGQLRIME